MKRWPVFLLAADERVSALHAPAGRVRPIVIPSYNGARKVRI